MGNVLRSIYFKGVIYVIILKPYQITNMQIMMEKLHFGICSTIMKPVMEKFSLETTQYSEYFIWYATCQLLRDFFHDINWCYYCITIYLVWLFVQI